MAHTPGLVLLNGLFQKMANHIQVFRIKWFGSLAQLLQFLVSNVNGSGMSVVVVAQ